MAVGRLKSQWDHTSLLWATLVNVHRSKDTRPATPDEIHPWGCERRVPKDREEHLQRRLALLPPARRAEVLAKSEARAKARRAQAGNED